MVRCEAPYATCAVALTLSICTSSCTTDPQRAAHSFVESGDRFTRDGRHAAAVIEYRNAVRETPHSRDVYEKLAGALDAVGRTEEARRALFAAGTLGDGDPLPQDETGLRSVVEEQPRRAAPKIALANRLLERGDTAEAEWHLRAALEIEPSHELANRALAALCLDDGRLREAEERLRTAAAATPQRYRSQLALADFLLEQRRFRETRETLERAALIPELKDAVTLRLAAVDVAEGLSVRAKETLTRLVADHPSAEAWTLLAQLSSRENDLAAAMDSAHRALELNPRLPAAMSLVDDIRWRQLHGDGSDDERPRPQRHSRE
jgi:Tfp pilus assembly protein PilF